MAAFDLAAYLGARKLGVDALLGGVSARLAERTPPRLLESMRYSLLDGGKRLRPILCLAFAEAVTSGARPGRLVEDCACAVELVHTYSLMHDDLPAMDDDDLRRGRPTNHKVFGEAMAILAGDALLTEAFGLVAGGPEPVRGALCRELAEAAGATGMVGGQVLDIALDRPAELEYLVRLHRLKTGALIRAACRMAVLAGGGDASMLASANAYGEHVGLAFQIADDLLDVLSTPEKLGKPTGADAAAGRSTFPALLGVERSRALAHQHADEAVAAVRSLEPKEGPLAAIARYAVERSS